MPLFFFVRFVPSRSLTFPNLAVGIDVMRCGSLIDSPVMAAKFFVEIKDGRVATKIKKPVERVFNQFGVPATFPDNALHNRCVSTKGIAIEPLTRSSNLSNRLQEFVISLSFSWPLPHGLNVFMIAPPDTGA